ncbi:MAG: hypothetical protein J2P48_06900 [Alphaproteobacteria bacterium]|nr:hypothetical protein [Alphaproteobacteria bacterium]
MPESDADFIRARLDSIQNDCDKVTKRLGDMLREHRVMDDPQEKDRIRMRVKNFERVFHNLALDLSPPAKRDAPRWRAAGRPKRKLSERARQFEEEQQREARLREAEERLRQHEEAVRTRFLDEE